MQTKLIVSEVYAYTESGEILSTEETFALRDLYKWLGKDLAELRPISNTEGMLEIGDREYPPNSIVWKYEYEAINYD